MLAWQFFFGFSPFICIFIDFGGDVSTAADEQTKLFRYWLMQEQLGLLSKLYKQSTFQYLNSY